MSKKQKTLFQSWGPSSSSEPQSKDKKSFSGVRDQDAAVIDLCEDEDLLLAQALDDSTEDANTSNKRTYTGGSPQIYPTKTNTNKNVNATTLFSKFGNNHQNNGDEGNLSLGAEDIERSLQTPLSDIADLPGFDKQAGRLWIYPTNYPVRGYQHAIVQKSLYTNTLVTLPTGLGKTFIAAVVMYNFYRWYPQGKVVFMAPTKPLVAQQIEACYNIMGIPQLDTAEMTGNMNPTERRRIWKERRVFFLTPQVMTNDLSRGTCPADDVKCLVIDEAHRASGNHAYCQVVRELVKYTRDFRILALSATPGSDIKAVQQVLNNLLVAHIELRTEECADIKPYTHERKVDKIVVPLGEELTALKNKYIQIMTMVVQRLTRQKAIYNREATSLSKFLILKAREAFRQNPPQNMPSQQYGVVEGDFALALSLYHGYELLQLHGLRSLYNFLLGIVSGEKGYGRTRSELLKCSNFQEIFTVLKDKFSKDESDLTLTQKQKTHVSGHPKMKKLEEVVLDHFSRADKAGDQTRVMIFSQYRDSVQEITDLLNLHNPKVMAMSFIGQSSAGKMTKGFTQKEQLKVMREFREGGYNTLISTCVGEEGLDIGDVDLIICFDAHKSPIRLVQRMGRTGRKREGRIVMLVTEGKEEQIYNQSQYSKKSIHRAIMNGAKSLRFYQSSPRMLPTGLIPVCHKMHITVQQTDKSKPGKQTKGKKADNQRKISTVASGAVKGSRDDEDGFLTEAEHRELREYLVPPHEQCTMPQPSPFISLGQTAQPDTASVSKTLSVSEWLPWQNRLQTTHIVDHSCRSKHLVDLAQFIQLHETLADDDDQYGMEMEMYLDLQDVLQPGEGDTELPPPAPPPRQVQPHRKDPPNLTVTTGDGRKKKRRKIEWEELPDLGAEEQDSDEDLPEFDVDNRDVGLQAEKVGNKKKAKEKVQTVGSKSSKKKRVINQPIQFDDTGDFEEDLASDVTAMDKPYEEDYLLEDMDVGLSSPQDEPIIAIPSTSPDRQKDKGESTPAKEHRSSSVFQMEDFVIPPPPCIEESIKVLQGLKDLLELPALDLGELVSEWYHETQGRVVKAVMVNISEQCQENEIMNLSDEATDKQDFGESIMESASHRLQSPEDVHAVVSKNICNADNSHWDDDHLPQFDLCEEDEEMDTSIPFTAIKQHSKDNEEPVFESERNYHVNFKNKESEYLEHSLEILSESEIAVNEGCENNSDEMEVKCDNFNKHLQEEVSVMEQDRDHSVDKVSNNSSFTFTQAMACVQSSEDFSPVVIEKSRPLADINQHSEGVNTEDSTACDLGQQTEGVNTEGPTACDLGDSMSDVVTEMPSFNLFDDDFEEDIHETGEVESVHVDLINRECAQPDTIGVDKETKHPAQSHKPKTPKRGLDNSIQGDDRQQNQGGSDNLDDLNLPHFDLDFDLDDEDIIPPSPPKASQAFSQASFNRSQTSSFNCTKRPEISYRQSEPVIAEENDEDLEKSMDYVKEESKDEVEVKSKDNFDEDSIGFDCSLRHFQVQLESSDDHMDATTNDPQVFDAIKDDSILPTKSNFTDKPRKGTPKTPFLFSPNLGNVHSSTPKQPLTRTGTSIREEMTNLEDLGEQEVTAEHLPEDTIETTEGLNYDSDEDSFQIVRKRKSAAILDDSGDSPALMRKNKVDRDFKTPTRPALRQKKKVKLDFSSDEDFDSTPPDISTSFRKKSAKGDNSTLNTSSSTADQEYSNTDTSSDLKMKKRSLPAKKHALTKKKKRRGCAFLEVEADLSGSEGSSDEAEDSEDDLLEASFVNDLTQMSQAANVDMQAIYLKSVRSPVGHDHQDHQFRLQARHLDIDVFSQRPPEEESQYMEDSFCVLEDFEESELADDWDELDVIEELPRHARRNKVTARTKALKELEKKLGKRRRIRDISGSSTEDESGHPTLDDTHATGAPLVICSQATSVTRKKRTAVISSSEEEVSPRPVSKSTANKQTKRDHGRGTKGQQRSPHSTSTSSDADRSPHGYASLSSAAGSEKRTMKQGKELYKPVTKAGDTTKNELAPLSCLSTDKRQLSPDVCGVSDSERQRQERLNRQKQKQVEYRQRMEQKQRPETTTDAATRDDGQHINSKVSTEARFGSEDYDFVSDSLSTSIAKPQMTSSKYKDQVVVIVDSREISGAQDIVSDLRLRHGCVVVARQLKACDYILSNRVAVDRKNMTDFSNGSNRAKLMERLQRMRELYDRCCLIVENDRLKPGEEARISNRTKYYDLIQAQLIHTNIRLFFTQNQGETCSLLAQLAALEKKKGMNIAVPVELDSRREQVVKFYMSIPKLNYAHAVNLCYNYTSVSTFLTSCSPKHLSTRGQMSEVRAAEVCTYVRHNYDLQMMPTRR